MAKLMKPVFEQGQKFVVCNNDNTHSFSLNDIVVYVGSIKKLDGVIYHLCEGQDGRSDYLVNGEFEVLPHTKLYRVNDGHVFMNDDEHNFLQKIASRVSNIDIAGPITPTKIIVSGTSVIRDYKL